MKVEESRSAFGYRKPSSEYRVVDFLADAYGFSRKNTFNFPTSTSTTTTSSPVTTTTVAATTTTTAPVTMSPLRLLSTRTAASSTDYADDSDEEEDTTMPSSPPPPAPLRLSPIMSKTSLSSSTRSSTEQVKMDVDTDSEDEPKSMFPSSPGRLMKQSFKDRQSHIEQEREKEESTTIFPTTMSPVSGSLKTPSGRLLAPRLNQATSSVDYETKTTARQGFTSTSAPSVTSNSPGVIEEDATLLTESMKNRISVHQLVSESMPSVSMSIVPVYFVNRVTKSVITVPYLTMKSISKMPLLPGMYGGDSSSNIPPMMNGLIKLQSHRIQRSNVKSGPSLFKLLQTSSTNNQVAVNNAHTDSSFDDDTTNSNDSPIKSFTSSSNSNSGSDSDWIPINVNNNPSSGLTSISDQW